MLTDATATHTQPARRKADRKPRAATQTQKLLTGSQISEEFGIPYRSVYDLYVTGKLPAVRFTESGRLRFRRQDIEALIERSLETA
jgi:predicted DNA-binding transcriptional regulator AlpA